MNNLDLPLLTIGKNTVKDNILPYTGPIKWTNKHECPPNFFFNEEGWVEIPAPGYPKCSVTSPLYLPKHYGTTSTIFLHNLLVLRFLNYKPHDLLLSILEGAMLNRGFFLSPEEREWVVETSLGIDSLAKFPIMDPAIYYWDTLWSSTLSKAQINAKRRHRDISVVRVNMEINRKYKTPEVKKDAGVSTYAIKQYWKDMGWTMRDRTKKALSEALDSAPFVTQVELARLSGLSLPTIRKYLPKNER